MTCAKCCSDAVFEDEVINGVSIPRCYICGWRHLVPEAPPILESEKVRRALPLTNWTKRQQEQGLCGNCEAPALPGLTYCADHLEFHQRHCQQMRKAI